MSDWIKSFIQSIGYPGISILMVIENVFPPIPSELIMPFAGYISNEGELAFIGVVAAGTIGSIIGALPLYYAGRKVGEDRVKKWADNYGRWFLISDDDIERANSWFDRHGALAVFICRLIPGLRSLISVPAGINRMHFGFFLLLTTIGTALWTLLLTWLGRMLGQNYQVIGDYLDPISYVVFGGFFLWYIIRVIRYKRNSD